MTLCNVFIFITSNCSSLKNINHLLDTIRQQKEPFMFYGIFILLISMVLAVLIRLKKCKKSCLIKKILPYFILFVGGILATFTVLMNK